MKYDVLSLGPARMDVFLKLPDEEVDEVCNIDRKRCVIELGFGEKIAVKGVEFAIGGNAGNNAVGLARLGLKSAMIGAMGNGWTDKRALEILESEGVDTKYVDIKKEGNGFGAVLNYQEERTILSYYSDALCCWPEDPGLLAEWIYLTSMGERYEDFYKQAVDWAKKTGAKIAFNPGTRQLKAGLNGLDYAFKETEVCFLNREEAAQLLGIPVDNIKKLLEGLREIGPKVIIITDGPEGTYAYDGQKYLHMPIVEAKVVERTGAGDAFGSGFLAGYIKGKPLEECLKWGTVNSASVLGHVGPQAGLLTKEKMEEWLVRAGGVKVEET